MKLEMKTGFVLLLAIVFGITSAVPVSAIDQAGEQNIGYSADGNASVEYIPEKNVYYIQNIKAEDVLEAFENDPEFEEIKQKSSCSKTTTYEMAELMGISEDMLTRKLDRAGATLAATYRKEYKITKNVPGVLSENVPITYTVYMNMSTVTYNRTEYAVFVSIYAGPTYALGSGSYSFCSTGTSAPRATIVNGGAGLEIVQIIQLETTVTYSVNAGINTDWFSFGASVGGNYYFRSNPKTYTCLYQLPLYNATT